MRSKIIGYCVILSVVTGTIINVPADQTTIQSAIDASTNGDTVLVQPGTYVENINFNGKNIVVGSLFLTTHDTSYISQTIIDGNQSGSVVTFENGEDSTAVLMGFIITNGNGTYTERPEGGINFYYGGGIYCAYSSPTLENITVNANTVENFGAGFYCHSSSPRLSNILISNNSAGTNGGGINCEYSSRLYLKNVNVFDNNAVQYSGGIFISDSEVDLNNMLISDNIAGQGGGFYAQNSTINFNNLVITNNTASDVSNGIGAGIYLNNVVAQIINSTIYGNLANDYGGGAYLFRNTELSIINSIFWNNSPNEIWSTEYGDSNVVNVSYTDILEGLNGIITNSNCTVNWLDSNIDDNPLFVDTTNNNFRLSDYSPCIGAGTSTNAPSSDIEGNTRPNPAGSLPDMGAYENSRSTPLDSTLPSIPQNLTATPGNQQITLRWNANTESDLAKYRIYRDTSSPATTLIDSTVSSSPPDTFYTDTGLINGQIYYYRITAVDSAGNESGYSDEVSDTTRHILVQNLDIGGNQDLQHLVIHTPTISANYYDSMGETQTHYQVQVSTDSTFLTADMWDSGEIASDTIIVQYNGNTLEDGQTYYLRVKVGSSGFWSDWSMIEFRMNSKPSTPIQASPVNNEVSGTPVVLKVLNSSDAENDTIMYSFNIYNDAGLTTKLDSVNAVLEGTDTTSWQVTATLPDNGQYWWNASANEGYEESPVSGAASFLLNITNDTPAAFALLSPTDSSEVDSLNPLLVWESAFDPDPLDTVRYTLYLGDDIPNLQIVDVDTSTNYQIVSPLMDNTTYYWKVVATDLHGASEENIGGYWSFRVNTENDLPGDFALLSPENGSMVTDLTPTFLWEGPIDPDDTRSISGNPMKSKFIDENIQTNSRSIESYDFYLGFDSSFTAVEPISVDTNQYTPFDNLAEDQLYYWKVIAFDDGGGNAVSDIWSFWTNSQNSIPSNFSVISPINGIDADTITPSFTWHTSIDNDLNDIVVYNIYLGESIEDIESVYTGFVPWISDTVFTLIEPTDDNTTYYWNVVATDLAGATNESEGGFQTFNVNLGNDPPLAAELISPDSVVVLTLTPEFHWTEATDPDPDDSIHYELHWVKDGNDFVDSVLTDTNYAIPYAPLDDNSKFFWWVISMDREYDLSHSDSAVFWTDLYPEPPLAFSTISPEDSANVLLYSEVFRWYSTNDPDPLDNIRYSLVYSHDWSDTSTYVIIDVGSDTSVVVPLEYADGYYWQVWAYDEDGLITISDDNYVNYFTVYDLGIVQDGLIPLSFALHQNYPNPFNPVTTIRYDLPEQSYVVIAVYDLLGRQVKTLVDQVHNTGYKSITWDGTNTQGQPVSAGLYFYQISAGNYTQTRKMVLIK